MRLILVFFFRRFVLFRRLILLGRFFLPLTFLLLFLLQLLLLLIVLLFELLKLLLLFLLELFLFLAAGFLPAIALRLTLIGLRRLLRIRVVSLRRSLRIRIVLLDSLPLLNRLGIRIAPIVWPRRGRTVVVGVRITLIRGSIARPVRLYRLIRVGCALVRWNVARLTRIARVCRHIRRVRRIRVSLPWAIRIALLHILPIVGPIASGVLSLALLVRRSHVVWRALPIGIALRHVGAVITRVLRWSLADWRRHLDVGPCDLSILLLLLYAAHLRDGWRPASILAHDLLLPGERHWSWRRSRPGDYRPVEHRTRRPHASFRACTDHAALLGRNGWRHRSNRSRRHFPRAHANHVVVHRSRRNESLM